MERVALFPLLPRNPFWLFKATASVVRAGSLFTPFAPAVASETPWSGERCATGLSREAV